MNQHCTKVPKVLLPKASVDLEKWAVVACDQYTSQPEYWREVEAQVGEAPSTLKLTLPEVYLEEPDVEARIREIHENMTQYLAGDIFQELPAGMILTERYSGGDFPRRGLVLCFDLECYDYRPGSTSLIRPTEKTVVERIPPRLRVRKGASLELPHIMLLIDDPERAIIEPLFQEVEKRTAVYDTELMQQGGHIRGWLIPEGEETNAIREKLFRLGDRTVFNEKYGCTEAQPLLPFAVGDGNHSMATAKAYWEEIKAGLTEAERENHPARFVLAELVNIHDESLEIHPIHRVLFQVTAEKVLQDLTAFYEENGCRAYLAETPKESAFSFPLFYEGAGEKYLILEQSPWALPVAALQAGLDAFLGANRDAKIDYIHGEDVTESLGQKPGNLGFLLPDLEKSDIFKGVVFDGVLPRKTFSMGEAYEKRYYMEAKRI